MPRVRGLAAILVQISLHRALRGLLKQSLVFVVAWMVRPGHAIVIQWDRHGLRYDVCCESVRVPLITDI